jgi:hypothetical protein
VDFVLADRVRETSTTTGTGAFALAGAAPGFRTFASGIGANVTAYVATSGSQWEVGIGTVSGASLSRDTVQGSSNAGNRVSWSGSAIDIRCDATASNLMQMLRGSVRWSGTSSGSNTIVVAPSPALHSYTTGLTIAFIAGASNTGAATINCGPGAVSLLQQDGTALLADDVTGGNLYFVVFTSPTAARILNPPVVGGTGGGVAGVSSFNGRTGAVVPGSTDYTAGMINESATRLWLTTAERNKLSSGVVTSFQGTNTAARAGAVVAQTGDYTAAQINETTSAKIMTGDERAKLLALPTSVPPATVLKGPFTAGTGSVIIGSIASNARTITVMLDEIGLSTADQIMIRIGDSGGIEGANYTGSMAELTSGGVVVTPNGNVDGWLISDQSAAVAAQGYCRMSFSGSNTWIGSGQVTSGGSKSCVSNMIKTLSGTLTQVEVLTFGSATFDEGTISVLVEG